MISGEVKFLLTHSSIYGLGNVISQLVAFVLLPLYTRYLTPKDYGVLEAVDISTGIIGIVVTMGIARAMSRFYYEKEEGKERNRTVSTTFISYTAIALACLPFLCYLSEPLAGLLFGSDRYGELFTIAFVGLAFGGLNDIGMMYLRLVKKPAVFISISTVRLLLLVGLNIVFIVYLNMGLIGILWSALIVKVLFGVGMTAGILWKIRLGFSFNLCVEMLRYGFPMIPSSLANTAVKESDKYFVLHFLSVGDMGIYSLALKFGNTIHNLLTVPFNLAFIPRRFEIMNRSDAAETYARIFTYYIFVVGYIGLILSVMIPEILRVMVTPEFYRARELVPLVVFSMIIMGCHTHFDFGILQSKKTQYFAYINVFCAGMHLLANFILVKSYGLIGGVWAAVLVLGVQAVLLYRVSDKLFHIDYEFRRVFSYLFLAGIIYGVSALAATGGVFLDLGIKVFVLAAFPVLAVGFRIVSQNETARLFGALKLKLRGNSPGGATARTS